MHESGSCGDLFRLYPFEGFLGIIVRNEWNMDVSCRNMVLCTHTTLLKEQGLLASKAGASPAAKKMSAILRLG